MFRTLYLYFPDTPRTFQTSVLKEMRAKGEVCSKLKCPWSESCRAMGSQKKLEELHQSFGHRFKYIVINFYFALFLVTTSLKSYPVGLVGQGIEHYISHCRFLQRIFFLRRQRNRRYVASLRVGARQIKSYSANSELNCNCKSSGTELTAVGCQLVHTPPWDIDFNNYLNKTT